MNKPLTAVDIDNKKIIYDGCMITKTGKVIDLFNPDPALILIEDIAHGLANTCRWNGHTQQFWSVSQHSCMGYDMLTGISKMQFLLHDAEEAYWGDIIKPIKNIIEQKCPEIKTAMDNFSCIIFKKFGIPFPDILIKDLDFELLRVTIMFSGLPQWQKNNS